MSTLDVILDRLESNAIELNQAKRDKADQTVEIRTLRIKAEKLDRYMWQVDDLVRTLKNTADKLLVAETKLAQARDAEKTLVKVRERRDRWRKRYEELESQTTALPEPQVGHPIELTTLEDYQQAPEGTIVVIEHESSPWIKESPNRWSITGIRRIYSDEFLASLPRQVLRWGYGE